MKKVKKLEKLEPRWIVNSLGELGVEINGRQFFLYKGGSIQYVDPKHEEDGSPMLYRSVGEREFGETCHPVHVVLGENIHGKYALELEGLRQPNGEMTDIPEDCKWSPLPAAIGD